MIQVSFPLLILNMLLLFPSSFSIITQSSSSSYSIYLPIYNLSLPKIHLHLHIIYTAMAIIILFSQQELQTELALDANQVFLYFIR